MTLKQCHLNVLWTLETMEWCISNVSIVEVFLDQQFCFCFSGKLLFG